MKINFNINYVNLLWILLRKIRVDPDVISQYLFSELLLIKLIKTIGTLKNACYFLIRYRAKF